MVCQGEHCSYREAPVSSHRGFGLSYNPTKLARLTYRSLKCFGQQFMVVGLAAFPQDQVWSTSRFVIDSGEHPAWKADDEIAVLNLDIKVRRLRTEPF